VGCGPQPDGFNHLSTAPPRWGSCRTANARRGCVRSGSPCIVVSPFMPRSWASDSHNRWTTFRGPRHRPVAGGSLQWLSNRNLTTTTRERHRQVLINWRVSLAPLRSLAPAVPFHVHTQSLPSALCNRRSARRQRPSVDSPSYGKAPQTSRVGAGISSDARTLFVPQARWRGIPRRETHRSGVEEDMRLNCAPQQSRRPDRSGRSRVTRRQRPSSASPSTRSCWGRHGGQHLRPSKL
jgi:hypothetical protein